ncbi:MAG: hypothetical protein L0H29_09470 [Sinobacteraceae bacterium]|nr:hypothetical protein [Nevskiaceae bacterium]
MGEGWRSLLTNVALLGGTALLAGCPLSGDAVSGICTYSNSAVIAQSKAGQSANAGLKALATQVQAKLQADGAKLNPHDPKVMSQFQVKKNILNARLRYTRAAVSKRIDSIIKPLLAKAYAAHQCAVLLDAGAVLKKGKTTNLNADVLKALDVQVQTVSFNLLQLPPSRLPQASPAPASASSSPAQEGSGSHENSAHHGNEDKR